LRRPPVFQENLSIQKQIRLFERADRTVRLTLRADMFNLFNRTNFTVNSAIGNANFGRATAPQNGPRIITMGARIEF
jgi:outer membrane receptor protein involved in Fe transport